MPFPNDNSAFNIDDDVSQVMTPELLELFKNCPLSNPQAFLNIYYGLVFNTTDRIIKFNEKLKADDQQYITLDHNPMRNGESSERNTYIIRYKSHKVSRTVRNTMEYDYENDCHRGVDISTLTRKCAVTGGEFPRTELVKATMEADWNTKTVWIHPSVVDNELSKFVTTLSGAITTKNRCYMGEDSNGNIIYLSHDDRYNSQTYGYFVCEDCGQLESTDILVRDHNGQNICQNCIDDHYSSCPSCGAWMNDNDEDDEDSNGCNQCGWGRSVIHDYNYKPRPLFKGDSNIKHPYIGFELELEARGESTKALARKVLDLFPDEEHLYNKYDSSLDNGVEIVSHPMTLEYHLTQDYNKLFKQLTKMGARSHNTSTCGLHFHLDKSRMSDAHKVRFGAFFALARHKLEVLARRTCESYAAFKNKTCSLTEFISEDNRYQAVNWTNSNTVEVRIFKGTLKYETFMASMELCQAIYSFTQKSSAFVCEFEENAIWDRFSKYVMRVKGDEFSFLKAFMEEKAELLTKAIEKDADIISIENQQKVKRKKLRLTDNVVEATLMTEKSQRRTGIPSPVFNSRDVSTVNSILDSYPYHSSNPVRINLEDDYRQNVDY